MTCSVHAVIASGATPPRAISFHKIPCAPHCLLSCSRGRRRTGLRLAQPGWCHGLAGVVHEEEGRARVRRDRSPGKTGHSKEIDRARGCKWDHDRSIEEWPSRALSPCLAPQHGLSIVPMHGLDAPEIISSRPWRSTWTQIHRLAPCLRSFSSRHRFSSKRARCCSWGRFRCAPSAEVRGGFPGPCPQRPRASRLMSRDTSSCHIQPRVG